MKFVYSNYYDLLESGYCKISNKKNSIQAISNNDFLGINITGNLITPFTFKYYYRASIEHYSYSVFIKSLKERGMIRAINNVIDTSSEDILRYEVALDNRFNKNIQWLLNQLNQTLPKSITRNIQYVNKSLSKIQITENAQYHNAALFFIGFAEKMVSDFAYGVDTFKMYYILRRCNSINCIGKNYTYDNNFFIEQLKQSGLKYFELLIDIIQDLIKIGNCNLWIAAVDFLSNKKMKFKIYIKSDSDIVYDKLLSCLFSHDATLVARQLKACQNWIIQHPELSYYGFALCIDTSNCISINLYF